MSEAAKSKPKILIQLDTDPQPSVFDAVTAIDSGVDHLLRHGAITPDAVRGLVHGAMFTRGLPDLRYTAVFVGGSDVRAGEAVLKAVRDSFFGKFRVSVLMDSNGANTTAAAALIAAIRSVGDLKGVSLAVLGGTGPVGQRVARLAARLGADVALGSRTAERARAAASVIEQATGATLRSFEISAVPQDARVVVAAGAAGAVLLPKSERQSLKSLQALVDLNAVPPEGIEGVSMTARGEEVDGVKAWGALGVGGIKMKIHKRAVQELFASNENDFDAERVLELGRSLE